IEAADDFGNTLLVLAAQTNNKKVCKVLLRRGANVNAQNALGNTALHYCNEYGYAALASYLVDKGADDAQLNANGLTCYEGLSNED
ncbi:ankyrin repeat-containing domain protein, partial [Pelagophyceae sp. CCMP2097]